MINSNNENQDKLTESNLSDSWHLLKIHLHQC